MDALFVFRSFANMTCEHARETYTEALLWQENCQNIEILCAADHPDHGHLLPAHESPECRFPYISTG